LGRSFPTAMTYPRSLLISWFFSGEQCSDLSLAIRFLELVPEVKRQPFVVLTGSYRLGCANFVTLRPALGGCRTTASTMYDNEAKEPKW
jgi:hypothetical protein